MAEKLESGGGTQIVNISALINVNEDIRSYADKGNGYLKTIAGYLEQINSKLVSRTPELTTTTGISNTDVIDISGITSTIGGGIGDLAGTLLAGSASGAIGASIGVTVGSAVAGILGAAIGLIIGNLIEFAGKVNEEYEENKASSFKTDLNTRYTQAQGEKQQSIQNGSAIAMEKEYAGKDDKNDTLKAKIEKLNGLQAELDEIAGVEYNKELEKGIEAKIKFIEDNKATLEKSYAAMGRNAGNDEATKMIAEVQSMTNAFADPIFQEALENGDTYGIETGLTLGLGNTQAYYDRTLVAEKMRNMNADIYKGIAGEFARDYDDLYEYQRGLKEFSQNKAAFYQDSITEKRLSYLDDSERQGIEQKAKEAEWNYTEKYELPDHHIPRSEGYYQQEILNERNKKFYYVPAQTISTGQVLRDLDIIQASAPQTNSGISTSNQQLQPQTVYVPSEQNSSLVPSSVNQTNTYNYNASVNVSKMEVMDKATIQAVVNETLNAMVIAHSLTPQIVNN